MHLKLSRAAALMALLVSALAIAACGGSTLDQSDLEAALLDITPQAGLDAESASCPDDVKDEDGTDFTCTLDLSSGEEVSVDGEIQVEGDTATPIFDLASLEGQGGTSGVSGVAPE